MTQPDTDKIRERSIRSKSCGLSDTTIDNIQNELCEEVE
jgi:hypothetical protein